MYIVDWVIIKSYSCFYKGEGGGISRQRPEKRRDDEARNTVLYILDDIVS